MQNCKPVFTFYGKISRDVAVSLKPMARALLTTIVCCINRRSNELRMSLKTLAEEAGMGVDTVIKWTARLEALGYLKVKRSKGGSHNDVNIYSLAGAAADTGLWNGDVQSLRAVAGDSPVKELESPSPDPSKKSRAGLEKIERFLNELNESSDDDEIIQSESDSGEHSFQNEKETCVTSRRRQEACSHFAPSREGRDLEQDAHDASRKYLEEQGVKAPALAEAALHPLTELKRAFEVAEQRGATNRPAYALSVLKHGDFAPQPAWMQPDYKPSPVGTQSIASAASWGSGFTAKSSAKMKTRFQKEWEGNESLYHAVCTCPDCGHLNFTCTCPPKEDGAHVQTP